MLAIALAFVAAVCAVRLTTRGCRFSLLVLALVACVAMLAGCGGSSKKKTVQAPTTSIRSTATGATTTMATPPKPLVSFDQTRSSDDGPTHMRVSIYDLRRDGPYLVLDFGVSCLDSGGCFTAGQFQSDSEGSSIGQIQDCYIPFGLRPGGITLVDPTRLQQYLAVRDSRCRPFTSQQQLQMTNTTTTYLAWARYPAPPASVTSLDVTFPDGGPQIPSVPISGGAGPTAGGALVAAQPAPFDQPPDSTDTTGLTLPVEDLVQTVGNTTGSSYTNASCSTCQGSS